MEIIVEGKGIEYFTPDKVILNLTFHHREESFQQALEQGSLQVLNFINQILLKNDFSKEDMKTRNFTIKESTKYNEATRQYEFDGYLFEQIAKIEFDYKQEKLAKMIEELSGLENVPKCFFSFGIKNEKECKRKIISKAYQDAEEQAKAIAEAAGKELDRCVKVDFKPFSTSYISDSNFEGSMMYAKRSFHDNTQNITNILTPQDILLEETIYCLWVTK